MKTKILKYLKHKFPLMDEAYADNIAKELEVELAKKEDDKGPTVEELTKIMNGDDQPEDPKVDLGLKDSL